MLYSKVTVFRNLLHCFTSFNISLSLLLGGNYLSVFMSVYPDLVHSVTPCVETVADRCISCGLISRNIYEQIIKRRDWIDTDQTRCLLNSIRSLLSVTPQALEDFVTVLLEVEDCKFVAKKMQQQLQ